MTRQEAVAILERLQEPEAWEPQITHDAYEALQMAIDALGRDNNVLTKDGDMISRQVAIDAVRQLVINGYGTDCGVIDSDIIYEELSNLPSAQPERKRGKWIYNSPATMKCDQCRFVIKDWDWHRFKFCPNCDCDMRGEQDGKST